MFVVIHRLFSATFIVWTLFSIWSSSPQISHSSEMWFHLKILRHFSFLFSLLCFIHIFFLNIRRRINYLLKLNKWKAKTHLEKVKQFWFFCVLALRARTLTHYRHIWVFFLLWLIGGLFCPWHKILARCRKSLFSGVFIGYSNIERVVSTLAAPIGQCQNDSIVS